MSKRLTTNDFIERAIQVHGGKYDYSKSEYAGKDKPIIIICPIHGEFVQTPNNHWKGKGCSKCSNNHKLTQSEFIDKANVYFMLAHLHLPLSLLRSLKLIKNNDKSLFLY